jgi:hypothetical protein
MPETLGTIELRMARLERRLRVLQQQYTLSSPYPGHQARIYQEYTQTKFELNQLAQQRQRFLRPSVAA